MTAIRVENLGKRYRPLDPHRPWTLQEALLSTRPRPSVKRDTWALRHVAFDVAHGETLGILGHNGAGKTTLLRLLSGVMRADEGRVSVSGAVSGLIDLGAGFHGDLTGRENVYLAGVIGGLTRHEVAQRFDDIVDFAELSNVVDVPLRAYSSGMTMRLAFAVAVYLPTQVLLVDEVLAVGDLAFQQKCLARIRHFKAEGGTIVLVSHDAALVGSFCDRALWLRQGQAIQHGQAKTVATNYAGSMQAETLKRTPVDTPATLISPGVELVPHQNRFGSFEVEITRVRISWQGGIAVDAVDPLRVEMEYRAHVRIDSAIVSVTITHPDGRTCCDVSTDRAGVELPVLSAEGTMGVEITGAEVENGRYLVSVGVYENSWLYAYDYHWQVYELTVERRRAPKAGEPLVARWFVA